MTALQPLAEHAHLPFHFLKAKDGHPFVALWQFGEWWTCGRGAPFEEDHLRSQGVTYSHPCDPAAIIVDADNTRLRTALATCVEALERIEMRTLDDHPPFRAAPVEAFLPLIRQALASAHDAGKAALALAEGGR